VSIWITTLFVKSINVELERRTVAARLRRIHDIMVCAHTAVHKSVTRSICCCNIPQLCKIL
jgi:hypothetical protein